MSFLAENDKLSTNAAANRTTSGLKTYQGYGVTPGAGGFKAPAASSFNDIPSLTHALHTSQITVPQYLARSKEIIQSGSKPTNTASLFSKVKSYGAPAAYDAAIKPVTTAVTSTAKKAEQQFKYLASPTSTAKQRQSIMTNQKAAATNPNLLAALQKARGRQGTVAGGIELQRMAAKGANTKALTGYLGKDIQKGQSLEKTGLSNLSVIAGLYSGGNGLLSQALKRALKTKAEQEAISTAGTIPRSALDLHTAPETVVNPKGEPSTSQLTRTAQEPGKSFAASIENPSIERGFGTAKNPKIPEVTPSNAVPKEGRFKNLISISGELSRQGKSGKEIADRLAKAESASETGQAAFLKKVPTVTKLKGKDFSNFVDTLGSLSKAEGKPAEQNILDNLQPKLKQAVKEWSASVPAIRQRAEDAGVDVGDLGKYYFPRNYSELLDTKKGLAKAAQHLVDTKQAANIGEAVQSLKFAKNEYNTPFGHFEKSRNFDLPNYDKSRTALVNYVSGAYNKIGHAEQFGPKGEVANTLIGQLGQEGHDSDRALMNYQKATGQFRYHNPGVDKALTKVRGFNRVTKLGLSSILNATQSVNTAAETGLVRTAKAALKQLSPADRAYIDSTGVRVESAIQALREQTGAASGLARSANKFQRGIGKIINAPGFGQVEKFNRGVAAVAGRDWANDLAKSGSPRAVRILRDKLGVEGDIGKTLTTEQQIQASRKVVELSQFKTGAKDLPGWADSPMGKTVAQFRTFSYKQTGFLYNELIKEAVKNKNPLPLMRFIALGVPVGIAAGGLRNELGGKPFYGDTKGQDELHRILGATYAGSSNVGGTGLAGSGIFLAQNAKSPNEPAYIAGDVGGPTFGLGASAILARSQGKTAEKRFALGQVPVAGPYLKSKYTPYGSAQERSFNSVVSTKIAKALVQAGYRPTDPNDARSKALKTSNPKEYQKLLDQSNKAFASKVSNYLNSGDYQRDSAKTRKSTLSNALSQARQKTLDQFGVKKPKTKHAKVKSY